MKKAFGESAEGFCFLRSSDEGMIGFLAVSCLVGAAAGRAR